MAGHGYHLKRLVAEAHLVAVGKLYAGPHSLALGQIDAETRGLPHNRHAQNSVGSRSRHRHAILAAQTVHPEAMVEMHVRQHNLFNLQPPFTHIVGKALLLLRGVHAGVYHYGVAGGPVAHQVCVFIERIENELFDVKHKARR